MSKKMTKKLVIGNWKMNPISEKEAEKLFFEVVAGVPIIKKTEVIICVPFIYLNKLKSISGQNKKVSLGAQDCFWGGKGPFTGEISAEMLSDIGVRYVILGHSERRALGETNIDVNKKIRASFSAGLIPIVCVGDKERDENHEYFNFVKVQLEECLNGIQKDLISKIIIAYEPIWALSTTIPRKDSTPIDSHEMVIFIKKILTDKFGVKTEMPRIIYGGSANDKNVLEYLRDGGVIGVLSGAASLDAKKFLEIINITEKI